MGLVKEYGGMAYDDIRRQMKTFSRNYVKTHKKTLNFPSKDPENKSLRWKRELTHKIWIWWSVMPHICHTYAPPSPSRQEHFSSSLSQILTWSSHFIQLMSFQSLFKTKPPMCKQVGMCFLVVSDFLTSRTFACRDNCKYTANNNNKCCNSIIYMNTHVRFTNFTTTWFTICIANSIVAFYRNIDGLFL